MRKQQTFTDHLQIPYFIYYVALNIYIYTLLQTAQRSLLSELQMKSKSTLDIQHIYIYKKKRVGGGGWRDRT